MAASLKTISASKYQVIYSERAILTSKNKHKRNGEFKYKKTVIQRKLAGLYSSADRSGSSREVLINISKKKAFMRFCIKADWISKTDKLSSESVNFWKVSDILKWLGVNHSNFLGYQSANRSSWHHHVSKAQLGEVVCMCFPVIVLQEEGVGGLVERDLLNVHTRIQLPMTNFKLPFLWPRQPISQVTHITRHLFPVFILWVILFALFPPHLLQFTFLPSCSTGRAVLGHGALRRQPLKKQGNTCESGVSHVTDTELITPSVVFQNKV